MIAAAAIAINSAQFASTTRPANFKDLSGRRFGRWTAKSYAGNSKWRCVCDCGNVSLVERKALTDERSRGCRDCAVPKKDDLTGDRYGHWTVMKRVSPARWSCQCDCGAIGKISTASLLTEDTIPGCAVCKGSPVRKRRSMPDRHYKCDFDAHS